jgi:hypothetical protein
LLVVSLLAGGACFGRGNGDNGVGPTVPPGGTSSTTSTSVVSYDVPAVIDLPYVKRVVSAYDHALGDAIRVLVRDQGLSDEFLKYLVGLYTEPEFEFQQKLWSEEVSGGRLAKTQPQPGDPRTTVLTLVRGDARCVIARAERDYGPTLLPEHPPIESAQDDYIVLVPEKPGRDPLNINPTPWALAFDGFKEDNSVPTNSCDD